MEAMKKIISFCWLFLIVFCISPHLYAEKSYIYNRSFEEVLGGKPPLLGRNPDGIKYWMRWTQGHNQQSSEFARTGKYSFKSIGNSGIYQDFSADNINSDQTYEASAYVFVPQDVNLSNSYSVLKLEWLNSSKRLLKKETIESKKVDNSLKKGNWVLIEAGGNPPQQARYGRITIEYRGPRNDSEAIYWDDANIRLIEQSSSSEKTSKVNDEKPEKIDEKAGEEIDWQW
jgi:hypothetical protein